MKVIVITEQPAPPLFPRAAGVCTIIRNTTDLDLHPDADLYIDLDFTPDASRIAALGHLLPSLVMVNAVTPTLAAVGQPFIRINGWPGFLERPTHELVSPDEMTTRRIAALYEQLGHTFLLAPDAPGMITARILATIINEAWYAWEEDVSTREEIDTAMRLGTNYPYGPFEWSERIGLPAILDLLTALNAIDSRYTPANSLRQAVVELKCD